MCALSVGLFFFFPTIQSIPGPIKNTSAFLKVFLRIVKGEQFGADMDGN
jgi:hypothetical protein